MTNEDRLLTDGLKPAWYTNSIWLILSYFMAVQNHSDLTFIKLTMGKKTEETIGDCNDRFMVEQILGNRTRQGNLQLLVKWQGYSSMHNSWEPLSNFDSVTCLADVWVMVNQTPKCAKIPTTIKKEACEIFKLSLANPKKAFKKRINKKRVTKPAKKQPNAIQEGEAVNRQVRELQLMPNLQGDELPRQSTEVCLLGSSCLLQRSNSKPTKVSDTLQKSLNNPIIQGGFKENQKQTHTTHPTQGQEYIDKPLSRLSKADKLDEVPFAYLQDCHSGGTKAQSFQPQDRLTITQQQGQLVSREYTLANEVDQQLLEKRHTRVDVSQYVKDSKAVLQTGRLISIKRVILKVSCAGLDTKEEAKDLVSLEFVRRRGSTQLSQCLGGSLW